MTYPICGACLHSTLNHKEHNGHFMYCANCKSLCELSEYNMKHKPTDISILMWISANKP